MHLTKAWKFWAETWISYFYWSWAAVFSVSMRFSLKLHYYFVNVLSLCSEMTPKLFLTLVSISNKTRRIWGTSGLVIRRAVVVKFLYKCFTNLLIHLNRALLQISASEAIRTEMPSKENLLPLTINYVSYIPTEKKNISTFGFLYKISVLACKLLKSNLHPS